MNTEILLLALACGMTLLAYMVAINAHGPTRLSLSYLIATVMLAGTVWCIVQYVNTGVDSKKIEELKKLEQEKRLAEEKALSNEEQLRANKDRMVKIAHLNKIISTGSGYATSLISVDLQDASLELDGLLARTAEMKKKVEDLNTDFLSVPVQDVFFSESITMLNDAMKLLTEAVTYYRLYYQAVDSTQELNREKVLRQKARNAYELFQKAGAKVAVGG
jgi:hypothetical protein